MDKKEAEAVASQGVSNNRIWTAGVHFSHPHLLFSSQLTVEQLVQREQVLAEAAQNVFKRD